MKTLYIECTMGAAGDMLMAGLLELIPEKEQFLETLNKLGIPGVNVWAESVKKCGVSGTHVHVVIHGQEEGHGHHHEQEHQHCHGGVAQINHLIDHFDVSDQVKADAKSIYQIIAEAESTVHGEPISDVHFHEVGTLDAVTDVVASCMLIEEIGAEQIVVSPIHVGSGTVKCAHGVLPVPAPATALILEGLPIYSGEIKGELCTPTGAAILKHFGQGFGEMPKMTLEKTGYGMGTKDFDQANCVRVLLGETEKGKDQVVELATNLDDMTGEEIGFAMEVLLEQGALDVYTESITMKKSRPAVKLVCMCKPKDKQKFTELIFANTTTIGIREYQCERMVLDRAIETRPTKWGEIKVKVCSGYGVTREKAEYEDIAAIAKKHQLTLKEVKDEVYR
ncbi:uncharacterized protein (TIGR00299 family) protein [Clostridiales Family XIII bacterium PM5-7]